jgi:hypothetical protein
MVVGLILTAALSRLIPHPWNFTPITAMALFGGANFSKKWVAFLVPLSALFLSNLILGFSPLNIVTYGCFAFMVLMGQALRRHKTAGSIAGMTITASVFFFVVTNFGMWAIGTLYPKTFPGLVACYIAAIPFFQNTLLGDACYSALLFGGAAFLEKRVPLLKEAPAAA